MSPLLTWLTTRPSSCLKTELILQLLSLFCFVYLLTTESLHQMVIDLKSLPPFLLPRTNTSEFLLIVCWGLLSCRSIWVLSAEKATTAARACHICRNWIPSRGRVQTKNYSETQLCAEGRKNCRLCCSALGNERICQVLRRQGWMGEQGMTLSVLQPCYHCWTASMQAQN